MAPRMPVVFVSHGGGPWPWVDGMREAFAKLNEEFLSATPTGRPLPGVTDNASLIAFSAFHESYHIGQMGYLRKMLGHTGVAG